MSKSLQDSCGFPDLHLTACLLNDNMLAQLLRSSE